MRMPTFVPLVSFEEDERFHLVHPQPLAELKYQGRIVLLHRDRGFLPVPVIPTARSWIRSGDLESFSDPDLGPRTLGWTGKRSRRVPESVDMRG